MSKRLSRNQSGYSEREIIIYRCVTLCFYGLDILAIIVIGLNAILLKNPDYGLYSLVPVSLLWPIRMLIDRFFPHFTPTDLTPPIPSNIRRFITKRKMPPDP